MSVAVEFGKRQGKRFVIRVNGEVTDFNEISKMTYSTAPTAILDASVVIAIGADAPIVLPQPTLV